MADEDPIVCEIPVHLADVLRGHLHVLQYPLRPVYRGMVNRPTAAKYKPRNTMVTLEYPVHTESNYNVDDHTPLPSTLPLTSNIVTPVSNYAVGVFRQGQLHLTPLSSVMQLRPSLHHLDEDSDEESTPSDDDMGVSDSESKKTDKPDVKEVQVQFKKRQSERALAAMHSSYAYKRSVIQSEKWIPLTIQTHEQDKEEFEELFSETETPVAFNVSPTAYLRALSYRGSTEDAASSGGDDVDMTGANDLDKKILDILTTDKVLHFKEVRSMLPSVEKQDILSCLDRVATIVRGCILPKCSLMKDHASHRMSIVEEFEKASAISRSQLCELHKVPQDIAKTLLQEYAVLNPETRMWQLKRSDDNVHKW
ncbi:DNA-directed RNA polymerase III subunit RPC5 [Thraustotheca clavata]|uniref:DNA-directed RNA polymerase III subunit RPC5 n=1 Tax=Thraustotheca clavata TaxID=74557 RepID=A0A1V9YTM4_9STRA|nr:DNA-directed RNA polymerase III subunit RPC5 [Thraustotheca clavata]